jgi:hypothetical protein
LQWRWRLGGFHRQEVTEGGTLLISLARSVHLLTSRVCCDSKMHVPQKRAAQAKDFAF